MMRPRTPTITHRLRTRTYTNVVLTYLPMQSSGNTRMHEHSVAYYTWYVFGGMLRQPALERDIVS